LVWTLTYAEANDGNYTGTMTSSDCGSGSLRVTLTNKQLVGAMVHSGTTYSLTGKMNNSGTGIDFYTPSNLFFFAGNASNGTISGTYMTNNGTVCNGVSFSLARETETADTVPQDSFNAIQELNARKEVTDKIVNEVFVAPEPRFIPGTMNITPSVTATSAYKYFNIPFSYAYSETIKFTTQLPIIYVDDSYYSGNVSIQGTHYSESVEKDEFFFSTVQFGLPTGSKKVGGGGFQFQASQARVNDLDQNRIFYSYSYRYTSEVDKLDSGDIINLATGLDFPLTNHFYFLQCEKAYSIATGQVIGESEYDGSGLEDDRTLLDLTLG